MIVLKPTINSVLLAFNLDAHQDHLDHRESEENQEWTVPMEDQENQDLTDLMSHLILNQHSHVLSAQLDHQVLVDHKEKAEDQDNQESLDIQDYQEDQESQDVLEMPDHKENQESKESQESKDHQEMILLEELESRDHQDRQDQEDQRDHQDPTDFHLKTVDHQGQSEKWDHQDHQDPEESQDHQDHLDHQEIQESQEDIAHHRAVFKKLLLHQFPNWIPTMSLRSHLVAVTLAVVMERSKNPPSACVKYANLIGNQKTNINAATVVYLNPDLILFSTFVNAPTF